MLVARRYHSSATKRSSTETCPFTAARETRRHARKRPLAHRAFPVRKRPPGSVGAGSVPSSKLDPSWGLPREDVLRGIRPIPFWARLVLREGLVYELLELGLGADPLDDPPVHEERRGRAHAQGLGFVEGFLDLRLVPLRGVAGRKRLQVEAEVGGPMGEVLVVEGARDSEEAVAVLEELSLLPGAVGGLRGGEGPSVAHVEGEVEEHEPHGVGVLAEEGLDLCLRLLAEGALVVGELDEGDLCVLRAQGGGVL